MHLLWNTIDLIRSSLDSPFAIGFISAFAGAFAGALGAQRIAERAKERSELLTQLRNTNAAITLAHTTCNGAIALNKQHVASMATGYRTKREAALAAIEKASKGEGPTFYRLEADLTLFPYPESPIDSIKHILFNNVSANGRALALVAVLDQSLTGLRDALQLRKDIAAELHKLEKTDLEFYERYLGIKNAKGHTNELYPNVIDVIESYTNDVAFFSALLAEDLVEHGTKIHQRLKDKFKVKTQKVFAVDYTAPRASGVIPPESDYADWLRGFKVEDSSAKKPVA